MLEKNIDRRKFLKLTSTGFISTFVLNEFSPLFAEIASSGKNISFLSGEFRKGIPTFCNLCPAQCGIMGFVEGNRLAGIQGNPQHPNNRGKICSRGIAGMNLVYDPQRLLFPLKRTGKRGQGEWTQISWKEALSAISTRLNQLRQQRKVSEIVFNAEQRYLKGITRRFLKALGQPTIVTSPNYDDPNKAYAQMITWGEPYEIPDVENSSYILLFGANPFESHPLYINLSQRIIEARLNNGAKLVTIDPRLSNTAGRSNEWIPIYPGTDSYVALAMANVIMENDLHDGEFINRWTNISVEELRSYLSQFSLEKAEEISTIPAQQIKQLAIDFATRKPSVAISGSGITKRRNGTQNERCIMLLNAVTGNIDKKGGFCLPRKFQLEDYSTKLDYDTKSVDFYKSLDSGDSRINVFISILSNPVYESPSVDLVTELMKSEEKVPFLVVIDQVMSETAMFADIVLPAATFIESWDISVAACFDFVPLITLGQPVIPAQGESKSLAEIWIRLAELLGGDIALNLVYNNIEDYVKEITVQVPGLTLGRDYNHLKQNGIWESNNKQAQYEIYKDEGFETGTGKFEIVSSQLRAKGQPELPQYIPEQGKISLKKNQLLLIPFTSNVMTPDLANAKWLSEINHTNSALINPNTARRLGIRDGQKIMLSSSGSDLEVQVKIFQGIHPKAIALCNGLGHWAYGKIAQAKKHESQDPDTKLLWWSKHGNGVNPNLLIEINLDPVGKGQSWKDTVVELKKA